MCKSSVCKHASLKHHNKMVLFFPSPGKSKEQLPVTEIIYSTVKTDDGGIKKIKHIKTWEDGK